MTVAGKWNVTMDTPIGVQKFVWDLHSAAGEWRGTMEAASGRAELADIRVNGERVSFEANVSTPMGAVHVIFDGAVQGDQFTGAGRTKFGDFPFNGQRA
jgi:quinohemoprotein ethanol dehydrogenase